MVPRTSRKKKYRKKHKRKLAQAFVISMSISFVAIGSAQLATPTYSEYNDSNDLEMELSSCFIFPKTITDYRDSALKLTEESKAGLEQILLAAEELGFDDLIGKVEASMLDEENGGSAPFGKSGDNSSLEGLAALSAQLMAEMAGLQSEITANNAKMTELQNLKSDLEKLEKEVHDFAKDLESQLGESMKNLDEIVGIMKITEEAKDKAESECNYEEDFFPNVLHEMDGIKEISEEIIASLNDELANTEQKTEEITNSLKELNENIETLERENVSLAESIRGIQNQVEEVEAKIQAFIKQQEEEAARKKAEEEEAARKKAEEEEAARKKAEEEEAARKKAEEDAKLKDKQEEDVGSEAEKGKEDKSKGDSDENQEVEKEDSKPIKEPVLKEE